MDQSLPNLREWPKWLYYAAGAALLLIVAMLWTPSRIPQPFGYVHRAHVLAFYEKGWDGNLGLPDLRKHIKDIETLSPFWYSVQRDGSIKTHNFEPEVATLARQNHVQLVPLVNNGGGNFAILQNEASMNNAITNLINLVKQNNLDGLNIDFELIPANVRDHLSEFMRRLRAGLPKGKVLGVSVFPVYKIDPSVSGAYDYAALGQSVDQFVIMLYNRHQDNSPPGPNAPLDWVRKNIEYALTKLPAKKIFVGVPGYGWDWRQGTDKADYRGSAQLAQIAQQNGANVQWDKSSQTPFFTYSDQTGQRIAWYESPESAKLKLNLINQHRLGGVAMWRIGFEQNAFWNQIRKEMH